MLQARSHILQLCSYYSSPLYRLLFDALGELGFEQRIYYPAVRGTEYAKAERDMMFDACYSQSDRLLFKIKSKKTIDSLYRHSDVRRFDIAHAHSLFSDGIIALNAKERFGTPYIVAIRNTDLYSFFRLRPWLRKVGIKIMREAFVVVFISPAYREAVFKKYVPAYCKEELWARSRVVPNGVSRLFLDNAPEEPRKADGTLRVLQVGDLNRNKNQLTAAKACEILRKQGVDAKYYTVGKVRDNKIAERMSGMSGVYILEPRSQIELIDVYRNADVFVMPSYHETFGLTYVEAMSQGLPIIYSKGQGFDGWFDSHEVGDRVDPRDAELIAESIIDCAIRRDRIFTHNVQAAQRFDWSSIARQYADIYNR